MISFCLKEDVGQGDRYKADKDKSCNISDKIHKNNRDGAGGKKEKATLNKLRLLSSHGAVLQRFNVRMIRKARQMPGF